MAYTTIDNPELYFQTVIWTGNGTAIGSGGLAVTFDGDEDMAPNLVWIKGRSTTYSHQIYDPNRGATKRIFSDITTAEETDTEALTAFGSDGFTLGSNAGVNTSSGTHVAWCWNESADAGFDIVTYTGNTTSGQTYSHSLSVTPNLMMVRCRNNADNFMVYHHKTASDPETDYVQLNTNAAIGDSAGIWNDTAPTSSVFTLGNSGTVNENYNYVAYLFAEKKGFSKFGSFVSDGQTDGNFVWTGFRPALVMIKRNAARDWVIHDNKRDGYNGSNENLHPNLTNAEGSGENFMDLCANGFKVRSDDGTLTSGGDLILYMAWAEAPFVNSKGVPGNAR